MAQASHEVGSAFEGSALRLGGNLKTALGDEESESDVDATATTAGAESDAGETVDGDGMKPKKGSPKRGAKAKKWDRDRAIARAMRKDSLRTIELMLQ